MRIRSVRQALTIIGRDQLRRWLQILLFTLDGPGPLRSPLMDLALRRGSFMERVAVQQSGADTPQSGETAFMVGMLSLADVLLHWPMTKVVDRLGVADEIRLPLLERQGVVGLLLTLCEMLEAGDFGGASLLAEELGLSMATLMRAQGEALAWAQQVASGSADSGQEGEAEAG
jgi:EAL and modified HD-GYP domain-containing signal transduction protein